MPIVASGRQGGQIVTLLSASLVLLAGCGGGTAKQDPSYFTIRPVIGQQPPPCVPPALPERQNAEVVRCYQLGPAQVDAHDVASAAVVPQGVEFTLSPEGAERFSAMARAVGRGGQAAIVVDGVVTSAPRFETTDYPGKGVVTGLDSGAAPRLANRLNGR